MSAFVPLLLKIWETTYPEDPERIRIQSEDLLENTAVRVFSLADGHTPCRRAERASKKARLAAQELLVCDSTGVLALAKK
jgi:hypothetical protein